LPKPSFCLKVLSIEIDLVFIKGRGAEIFSKLRPHSPSYESHLKF
jgi:hypothetical protein